jgi:hypothetical protein
MSAITVGDIAAFAIESCISRSYEQPSLRGLGYFVIHLDGKIFGVKSNDATLLACSFDEVNRRIARRGTHSDVFGDELNAARIADAVRAVLYDAGRQDESFFGMSSADFQHAVAASEIVWAPDGDEAFDDGSHVLQFDQG